MRYFWVFLIVLIVSFQVQAAVDIFGKPFSNGSPSCTGCHSIKAAGFTAKTWGPDLSSFFSDMGEDPEAIKSFILESGIEPMDAVYSGKNIPENELNALIDAFSKLNTENVSDSNGNSVVLYAFMFFIILLIALRLIFKKNSLLEVNK